MASKRRLDAVIFDFDGTLVDTVEDVTVALNATLSEAGVKPLEFREIRAAIGLGGEALIRAAIELDSRPASPHLISVLHENYQARCMKAPIVHSTIYGTVAEELRYLKENGVPLFLCTNKRRALVYPILRAFGLHDAFENIVCADTLDCMKPDARVVAASLNGLACDVANVVLLGDTSVDAMTAANAGVHFIHARYGYGSLPALSFPHAIDAFSDLRKALQAQDFQIRSARSCVGRNKCR